MLVERLDNTTRITHRHRPRRNVARHHRPGANRHIVADGHTRQNRHRAANPHIIANRHRQRPLPARVSLHWVSAVACRINAHIGPHKAVITDGHTRLVKHREIKVGKKTLANADVLAIVAVEWLIDQDLIITHMAQQVQEHARALFHHRRQQPVITMNNVLTLIQLSQQFRIDSRIDLSRQHFLFLAHLATLNDYSGKGTKNKSALLSRAMLTIMFNPKKPPKIMSSNLYLQLPCQL